MCVSVCLCVWFVCFRVRVRVHALRRVWPFREELSHMHACVRVVVVADLPQAGREAAGRNAILVYHLLGAVQRCGRRVVVIVRAALVALAGHRIAAI